MTASLTQDSALALVSGTLYWFMLEIRDPNFSYEEIRDLFGDLAQRRLITPTTSSASQREKLERLRWFVSERRDLRTPPMAWVDIVEEWNTANPDEHYTHRSIQRAYARACKIHGEQKPPVVRGRRSRPNDPPR